jgi:hypothetical protein
MITLNFYPWANYVTGGKNLNVFKGISSKNSFLHMEEKTN